MMTDEDFLPLHRLFKGVLTLLAVLLLGVSSFNFYRFSTATTDENLFKNSPSRFIATASLPAQLIVRGEESRTDSIKVGDLIISIDGRRLRSASEVRIFLQQERQKKPEIRIFRPAENNHFTYQLTDSLPDNFLFEMPPAVYVFQINEDGVSDLAGMKIGDLIVEINGQGFENFLEADAILRSIDSGQTILYQIYRDGKNMTLPVTLAKFGVALPILLALISGLLFWGAGVFIGLRRPNLQTARLLSISFMGFGFQLMVAFCQRDVVFDSFAQFRSILLVFSLPLAFATWIHSKSHFPSERPELLKTTWIKATPYAIAAMTGLLTIFISYAFGALVTAQIIYFSGLFIMLIFDSAVQFGYRNKRTGEYKKIRRFLSLTAWGSLILSGLLYLILNNAFRNAGYIILPFIAVPLAYLYTIGRYQLLGLSFHIKRNIQYIIVTSIWISLLVVGLIRILALLPKLYLEIPNIQFTGNSFVILEIPPDSFTHDFWEKMILIFLALAAALFAWWLAQKGKKVIDKIFNRQQYNLSRATGELAEIMATKLGLQELARGIIERLAKLMELKRVGVLFFRDQKKCCCHEAFGFDGSKWEEVCLRYNHKLVQEMHRFRSESRLSIDYLPQDIKDEFRQHGFRHLIPIRFKNRLVGIFVIGEKLSESPLNLDDLTFLAAVAKQASIAIENAFLHEELTEQERMKHELEIARRIQMASLPQKTPLVDGLDISGVSIPALEVGGDYFDYLNGVTPGITVIVGDVSGKGTSAALYMSKVQGIIRSLHAFELSPRELFIRANKLLCQDMEKQSFITALGAYVDTSKRQLKLARAGHLPLFYYRSKSKKVEMITPKGLGMGLEGADLFENELEECTIRYKKGDVFLFATDGITEAQINGSEFGEHKLSEILQRYSSANAETIREKVILEVKEFVQNGLPHDDQTVVVVKIDS